jgi:hypothetical protein
VSVNKRCQEPISYFFGRLRGRKRDFKPKRHVIRSTLASLPNGCPRLANLRSASNSFSVSIRLTRATQSRGRSTGQSESHFRVGRHCWLVRQWDIRTGVNKSALPRSLLKTSPKPLQLFFPPTSCAATPCAAIRKIYLEKSRPLIYKHIYSISLYAPCPVP